MTARAVASASRSVASAGEETRSAHWIAARPATAPWRARTATGAGTACDGRAGVLCWTASTRCPPPPAGRRRAPPGSEGAALLQQLPASAVLEVRRQDGVAAPAERHERRIADDVHDRPTGELVLLRQSRQVDALIQTRPGRERLLPDAQPLGRTGHREVHDRLEPAHERVVDVRLEVR